MAATLTAGQEELVHFSFPIEKREDTAEINPVDGTPDIWILGKATDGTLDGDREIVDPEWSAKALQEWASTGGNVRMSHDPKRPVGKGHEVHVTTDGHWVKSLISDPLAKHFIRQGVLNDYSVGISDPDFRYQDRKLDPHGKALRIITGRPDGRTRVAELSVCDRGSNFNSRFTMVKSAGGGFTGQMVGDEDEIAKAAPASLTKMAHGGYAEAATSADMSRFGFPEDLSVTFTPSDMAKLFQGKIIEQHYDDLALKAVIEAEAAVYKRDIDTATRRRLRAEGRALPNLSYPIENAGDLDNAAHLARTGHGDVAAARRLIARRARELGVANPLDESDGATKSSSEAEAVAAEDVTAAVKEAEPEVTKEPEQPAGEPEDRPVKKARKKPKGPKKLPPWLNKPADGDDGDGDNDDAAKSCKSVTDHLWTGVEGTSDIVCSKCHTTPAEAAGLSGTHDMTCAPVPELLESPPVASTKSRPDPASASGAGEAAAMDPAPSGEAPESPAPASASAKGGTALEAGLMRSSPEVAAILRFKHAGMDIELGRLHDLTCPAYHPDDVAKCHPFSDLSMIDVDAFQREAVKAACGPDMDRAKSLHLAWQAAAVLKKADPAELNDYRLAAHKAFRDANPGPGSAPTPGSVSPGKYNRPLITDGRSAASSGHDGPNTSPQVATNAPDAHSFDRPPLEAGHQSPSPSFMKASFEYPTETGRPVRLDYAVMEKERARHALMQMHEHLSRQFPEVCPMDLDAPVVQPQSRGVPPTAGIGKSAQVGPGGVIADESPEPVVFTAQGPVPFSQIPSLVTKAALPVAAVLKAPTEDDLVDDAVYKGFKKMRKKLGKKVLSGDMTVDEARARMGRRFAQKAAEPAAVIPATYVPADPGMTPTAIKALQDSLNKMADDAKWQQKIIVLPAGTKTGPASPVAAKALDADLIKAAVREAIHVETVPLEPATLQAFDPSPAIEAAVTKAVTPLLEKIQAQDTKLAETQRVIDAIADQPDPSTAAFSGLAFNPVRKNARPAGVLSQAEAAERSQQMMIRHVTDTYNSASDPYEREAARATLTRLRGGDA